jgi:hypothetical protein
VTRPAPWGTPTAPAPPAPPTWRDPRGRPLQQPETRSGAWRLVVDHAPRCWACGKQIARYVARPWSLDCKNGHANSSAEPEPA